MNLLHAVGVREAVRQAPVAAWWSDVGEIRCDRRGKSRVAKRRYDAVTFHVTDSKTWRKAAAAQQFVSKGKHKATRQGGIMIAARQFQLYDP